MTKSKSILSKTVTLSLLLTLFSCKKDYVCSCTQIVTTPGYSSNGTDYPQQVVINTTTNTYKSKKKNSVAGCKMGEYIRSTPSPHEAQGQGPTVEVVTCELK